MCQLFKSDVPALEELKTPNFSAVFIFNISLSLKNSNLSLKFKNNWIVLKYYK